MTTYDMMAPPTLDEIVTALREGAVPRTAGQRAATELLIGYDNGRLLEHHLPGHLRPTVDENALRITWSVLRTDLNHGTSPAFTGLSDLDVNVLKLACALAAGDLVRGLNHTLSDLAGDNAIAAARAFAIALGVRTADTYRLARDRNDLADRISRLRAACRPTDEKGGMADYVRLADDEPDDTHPALAIHVADIERIIDGAPGPGDYGDDIPTGTRPAPPMGLGVESPAPVAG